MILDLGSAALFATFILGLALSRPANDLTRLFTPAGRLLLAGADPYALNADAVFPYLPTSLWVFPLFTLPHAYHLMLIVNALAAVALVRVQRVGWVWLLHPPLWYALAAGQLDIGVCLLACVAGRRGSVGLMALAVLIKPQAAAFWCVPWILADWRRGAWLALLVGAVSGASWLLAGEVWASWRLAAGAHGHYYAVNNASLWSAGAPVGALVCGLALLRWGRDEQVARPLWALAAPVSSYYGGVGLLGAGPVWVVGVSWVAALTGALWLEPVVMLAAGSLFTCFAGLRPDPARRPPCRGATLSRIKRSKVNS